MNEDCDGGKYPVKVEISEPGESHRINILDGNTNNTTIANTDLIKEIHECQFCDKTYPSKTQLSRHLREKHGVKTYKKHIKLFPSEIKNLMSSSVAIKVEPLLDNVTNEDLEDENTKITSITNTDPFRDTLTVNPWQVESIEAFAYLKCPECVFDCKEEVIFQNHAVENHPLSNVLFDVECNFFEKTEVKQELSDISVVKQEVSEEYESIETELSKSRSNQTFSLGQKPVYGKNDSFSCHICQISFDQKKHYKAHITHLNQDGTRSLKCCACDKKFSFGNGIRTPIRHIESVHLGNSKTHLKLKQAIEEDKKLQVSRVKIFPSIKNIKEEISVNDHSQNTSVGRSLTFKCYFCAVRFIQFEDLKQHIGTEHEGKKPHNCSLCNSSFILKAQLSRHFKNVHEKYRPHKCSVCDKGFSEARGLSHHIAHVHEGKKLYSCPICDDGFDTKILMKNHLWDAHEIDGETVHEVIPSIAQKPVYDRRDPYSCHICLITFHQQQYYRSHITTVQDGKKSLMCCACNSKFSYTNTKYLTRHIAKVHEGKSSDKLSMYGYKSNQTQTTTYLNTIKKPPIISYEQKEDTQMEVVHEVIPSIARKPVYDRSDTNSCHTCQITFNQRKYYRSHITSHRDGKKVKRCCACNATFSFGNNRHLMKHILKVHKGKPYKCSFCSDCFIEKEELVKHKLSVHEGKKLVFKCAICHADFDLKSTLKTHMEAVHEDIESIAQKPVKERVKCLQCDKTYSNRKELENHVEVVHLQLKKFQCDQCPLNFASKNGFEYHVASEHEKKEHSCTQCDRIYKTKIGLKDHVLRFHEKRLDFKCEFCGKEFPSLAEVNRHVRLIHNGIKVKCDLCDKEINTSLRLWKHKVFRHNETQDAWICKKCPRKRWSAFQTQAIYDKHMKEVHEGIKPNKCNICSRMFSTMKTLNLHISKIHEASEENQYHMAKKKST